MHHRERAQALIEFALVAPFIFILLFAIVDFSIAIDQRLVLQHAVREGARFGAVHTIGSTAVADVKQLTADQTQSMIGTTKVKVCYTNSNANSTTGDVGDAVTVSVINNPWNFPILSEMAARLHVGLPSIPIEPSGTARLEGGVSGYTATPC